MTDADNGNRIVFNGEVYNFRALRGELQDAGYVFQSTSDTEVLLKLYDHEGPSMLHRIRGMFAFAIWDRQKQALFVARDPFGIKPLYLADDGKTLRFASQVKALLAGGAIDTSPEAAGHVGFFVLGSVPEPYTLFKGIRALPAGHFLWLDKQGRASQKSYLDLADIYSDSEAGVTLKAEDAHGMLQEALRDSVQQHLIADVPVGVFLSAGLDSTTVAALAKESGLPDLRTVTLGFHEFAGTEKDEVPLAEAMAQHLRTQHQTRWINREDFAGQYKHLLSAMDQPSIDGVNSYFVAKAAHEAGLKAALSGLGGDELFAGYNDFRSIPLMVRYLRPLTMIPGLGRGFRLITAPLMKRFTSPKAASLLEYGGDYAGAYLLRRGLYMPWELQEVLDGDLVKQGWLDLQLIPALRISADAANSSRQKISLLETAWYMRNQLLRDTDWASMAHSLEVRVPLVDLPLARTVAQLSAAGMAPDKRAMASAPRDELPADLLNRRKTGFMIPVREWMVAQTDEHDRAARRGLRGWAEQLHRQQGLAAA